MKITWFGHSCFRIDTGASSILIDPFLSGNPTFEASGLKVYDAIKGVTHVALTHGHEDHTGDVLTACEETGAMLIAVFELATHLESLGVTNYSPGNTGGMQRHEDFDLTFVPAWHSAGIFHEGRSIYLGACCGLVIQPKQGKTVYHMGDTAICSDMASTRSTGHKSASSRSVTASPWARRRRRLRARNSSNSRPSYLVTTGPSRSSIKKRINLSRR